MILFLLLWLLSGVFVAVSGCLSFDPVGFGYGAMTVLLSGCLIWLRWRRA